MAVPHLAPRGPELLARPLVRVGDVAGRVDANGQRIDTALRERAVVEIDVRREPERVTADDREHERHSVPGRSHNRLGAAADADPRREATALGGRIHAQPVERRARLPAPRHRRTRPIRLEERGEQLELLLEQRLVLVERVAEERERLDERAAPRMISARPFEAASSDANRWNTRTGSSELSTVTAEPSRMRFVRPAMAARTTSGMRRRSRRGDARRRR
jgi:hypothetical protein